jgi:hypothetical protein
LGLKAAIEINGGTRKKKSLWKANRAKESRKLSMVLLSPQHSINMY